MTNAARMALINIWFDGPGRTRLADKRAVDELVALGYLKPTPPWHPLELTETGLVEGEKAGALVGFVR